MKKLLILAVALVLSACSQPTPQEQVQDTVKQIITAIDNGEKQLLIDKYVDLGKYKITADDLKQKNLDRLKKFLVSAEKVTPVMNADNTEATFELEDNHKPLTFKKTAEGQWKLQN